MPYFGEPVGRVKIQTTSKNLCVQANFADIYLRGMRDRSMRSGTEFVFFVVMLFLFASINDEISLSCNWVSSLSLSNILESIFASHSESLSSEK